MTILGLLSFSLIIPEFDSKIKNQEIMREGIETVFDLFHKADLFAFICKSNHDIIYSIPPNKNQRYSDSISTLDFMGLNQGRCISISTLFLSPEEKDAFRKMQKPKLLDYLNDHYDIPIEEYKVLENYSKKDLVDRIENLYDKYTPSKEELDSWYNMTYDEATDFVVSSIGELGSDYASFGSEIRRLTNKKSWFLTITVICQALGLLLMEWKRTN